MATRKRPPGKPRTADESVTDQVTEPPASTETADPAAVLTSAYWAALDERDETTGTIDAVRLDAVRVAYLAVPKRQRGDLVTKLNVETLQRMAANGGTDPGMLQATQQLLALFTEINENGGKPDAPPHDPVPSTAGLLAALDYARESILAALTPEQREQLGAVDPDDPEAKNTSDDAVDCLAKIGTRVVHGRKRRKPQRSGKDLGQVIRDVVDQKGGGPVDISTIAKIGGVKPSGLWSRHDANKTPGVKAVTDDRGRRAFVAAA
jgi:hypothetical protein